ncbi:oxidase ustYa family protein [Aspergillus candidus]|uniref:Tat pathway signal sequence n=1 Tax=Aspergillus candidus TaxID=41067 RepID=A0A2I2FGL1_ASPCN|nr:hypothetical protein BDW47DRAFT_124099 [Aspergillus candidus]PLB39763.1 hypothetical protein BDW47DRAFT_124099 [Aspergillus candidus]
MRDFTQYTHLRQSSDLNVDLDDRTFKEQDTFLPRSRDSDETREFHCEEEDTPFTHRSSAALVAHAVLLVCNTVILGLSVLLWLRGESNCPMEEAVAYTTCNLTVDTKYFPNGTIIPDPQHKEFGPPGPEADAVWSEMLEHSNIRLSRDELNEDYHDLPGLVEFSDGSGIYGSVAVYHSIHCIKRVHHLLHFDHYHPNKSAEETRALMHHGEHCLSYLMEAVKCNADLTVFPMQWGTETRIPLGIDQGQHQCKDWGRIEEWMKTRSVDIYTPGLLVHPKFGWAYADGVEHLTGVAPGTTVAGGMSDGH